MTLFIKYDGKEFTKLYGIKSLDELGDAFDNCRALHEDSRYVLPAFFKTDTASRIWQAAIIIAHVFIDPYMESRGIRALRCSTSYSKDDCIKMYNESLDRILEPDDSDSKKYGCQSPMVKELEEKCRRDAAS